MEEKPIKTIKCGDIEVPVEYLKQTAVTINGDDYIRLQQENKQLKELTKDKSYCKTCEELQDKIHYKHIIDELEKWLEEKIDMCFTTIPDYEIYIARQEEKHILQEVLNKLQELKGSDEE